MPSSRSATEEVPALGDPDCGEDRAGTTGPGTGDGNNGNGNNGNNGNGKKEIEADLDNTGVYPAAESEASYIEKNNSVDNPDSYNDAGSLRRQR